LNDGDPGTWRPDLPDSAGLGSSTALLDNSVWEQVLDSQWQGPITSSQTPGPVTQGLEERDDGTECLIRLAEHSSRFNVLLEMRIDGSCGAGPLGRRKSPRPDKANIFNDENLNSKSSSLISPCSSSLCSSILSSNQAPSECKATVLECRPCKKVFQRKCVLTRHLRQHQKPIQCTFSDCNRAFPSKQELIRHEQAKHGRSGTIFPCPFEGCQRSFGHRRDNLLRHIRVVHTARIMDGDKEKDNPSGGRL